MFITRWLSLFSTHRHTCALPLLSIEITSIIISAINSTCQNAILFGACNGMLETKYGDFSANRWFGALRLAHGTVDGRALEFNTHWVSACSVMASTRVLQQHRMPFLWYGSQTIHFSLKIIWYFALRAAVLRRAFFVMSNQLSWCTAIRHLNFFGWPLPLSGRT